MNTGWLMSLLGGLATQIPMFLVLVAGAAVGIARWKRHPRVSQFLVCSTLFLAMVQFGVTVFYSTASLWLYESGIDTRYIGWIFTAVSASTAFASALAHGVLIASALVDRPAVRADAG